MEGSAGADEGGADEGEVEKAASDPDAAAPGDAAAAPGDAATPGDAAGAPHMIGNSPQQKTRRGSMNTADLSPAGRGANRSAEPGAGGASEEGEAVGA